MPEALAGLDELETKAVLGKDLLRSSLEASGRSIADLLRKAIAEGGNVKGFMPHATAFLGYLIAHVSHHRGQGRVTPTSPGVSGLRGDRGGVEIDVGVGMTRPPFAPGRPGERE